MGYGTHRTQQAHAFVLDASRQSSFDAKALIDDLNLDVVSRRGLVVSAFVSKSSDSAPRSVGRFCAKTV